LERLLRDLSSRFETPAIGITDPGPYRSASASSWCDEDTEFVDFSAEKELEQGIRCRATGGSCSSLRRSINNETANPEVTESRDLSARRVDPLPLTRGQFLVDAFVGGSPCHLFCRRHALPRCSIRERYPSRAPLCHPCGQSHAAWSGPSTQNRDLLYPYVLTLDAFTGQLS
jgi:hypothetical protein